MPNFRLHIETPLEGLKKAIVSNAKDAEHAKSVYTHLQNLDKERPGTINRARPGEIVGVELITKEVQRPAELEDLNS